MANDPTPQKQPPDRLLRTSPRPLHAVLHRVLGALQLLRHAGAPDPVHDRHGGPGWARLQRRGRQGPIYGLYTAVVYLLALPGGWVADRLLGQRRAVFVGGCHHRRRPLQPGRRVDHDLLPGPLLIVIGTGLLKPNISTMVGELYPRGGRPPRRRVLDLLHGHQPRRLRRASGLRLPRAKRQLALGLRRRRRRHGARPHPVHPRRQAPGHRRPEAERRGTTPASRRKSWTLLAVCCAVFLVIGLLIATGTLGDLGPGRRPTPRASSSSRWRWST